MLSFFHDEVGLNVDNSASDGFGRLYGQVEVLDLLVDGFGVYVYGCGGDGGHFAQHCGVDEFAGWGDRYQRMMPSPTYSKMFLWLMGRRGLTSGSFFRTQLTWLVKAILSESSTVWMIDSFTGPYFMVLDRVINIISLLGSWGNKLGVGAISSEQ